MISGGSTSTLARYSNLDANNTFVQKSFDPSAFTGKTVTVKFLGTEDRSKQTSFVIDDTSLTVG